MPPKKGGKGGKKKKDDNAEPPHDKSWEKAVETGVWDRPVTDLPDANTWPTWGALRERVLLASKEIRVNNTASLRDAFASEIVKLSPQELSVLDVRGSTNLRNFVLSPISSCPKLTDVDLSECATLDYVMLQSQSIRTLNLKACPKVTKVLVHCPRLNKLSISDCPQLEVVMIWSDELMDLDLTGCNNLSSVKLQCPNLLDQKIPPLKVAVEHVKPVHPPIAFMLKENLGEAVKLVAEAKEKERRGLKDDCIIAQAHRPF